MRDNGRVAVGKTNIQRQVSRVNVILELDCSLGGLLKLPVKGGFEVFRVLRYNAFRNSERFAPNPKLDDLLITATLTR